MVLRLGSPDGVAVLLVAIAGLTAVCAAILLAAVRLERWLSPAVMGILMRLQRLLLGAIAVQMMVSGIRGAFGITGPAAMGG